MQKKTTKQAVKKVANKVTNKAQDFNLMSEVEGAFTSAKKSLGGATKSIGGMVTKENLPVALISFGIGAAIGALGAIGLPMLKNSELAHNLGAKLTSATGSVKQKISEGVAQAKTVFHDAVKEENPSPRSVS